MSRPDYVGYNRRTGTQYVRVKQTTGGMLRCWTEEDRGANVALPENIIMYEGQEPETDRRGGARTPGLKSLVRELQEPEPVKTKPHKQAPSEPFMTLEVILDGIIELRRTHPDYEIIFEVRLKELE